MPAMLPRQTKATKRSTTEVIKVIKPLGTAEPSRYHCRWQLKLEQRLSCALTRPRLRKLNHDPMQDVEYIMSFQISVGGQLAFSCSEMQDFMKSTDLKLLYVLVGNVAAILRNLSISM